MDTVRPSVDLDELVRALVRDSPPEQTDPPTFLRAQCEAGLAWVHFPVGHGGCGASVDLQDAVDDRLRDAGAPPSGRVTIAAMTDPRAGIPEGHVATDVPAAAICVSRRVRRADAVHRRRRRCCGTPAACQQLRVSSVPRRACFR